MYIKYLELGRLIPSLFPFMEEKYIPPQQNLTLP